MSIELLKKRAHISFIPKPWSLSTVGEACKIENRLRKPISTEDRRLIKGDFPYYGPTGILAHINEWRLDGKYALIGEDGDHFLKPNEKKQSILVEGKFNVNNHAHIISATDKCLAEWFFVFFQHRDINEFLTRQGANRYKLNKGMLLKLPILIPPLPEQKAIVDFLSTWDQAIKKTQQLTKAKEKKLRYLYRVLLQTPIIEKKWNTKQLGDLFVQVSDKVGDKDLVPHSISAGRGFISQKEKWGKDISGKQYKHYTHLKAGQISYNKGNSKRYKQGCAYLLRSGEVCVPSVFISFKPSSSDVNVEFFEHYFAANYHSRELKKFISSGARSDGLLNLNKKDFFKIKVPHPNLEQQDEVSECLTGAGKEIELLKKLLTQYQTQKRGLMQRLLTGEWRVNLTK